MSNKLCHENFFKLFSFSLLTNQNQSGSMFSTVEIPSKNQGVTKMKITRKKDNFTEDILTDMYAESLLQKYYEKKYGDDNMTEEYLCLAVWVDKLTGIEHLYDISSFDNYDECKEDDKLNRTLFNGRCNCYILFITGKRLVFLKDKPLYTVIEAEAIER